MNSTLPTPAQGVSSRRSLNRLIAMFLGAVVVVALVGILTTFLISARTTHMARQTSPLQVDLARLMGDIERAAKLFTMISVVGSEAELAAIKGQCQGTITDAAAAVEQLTALHAGIDSQPIDQLRQAFAKVSEMAVSRLAADAAIRAAHRQIDEGIEAMLAIHGRLAEAMSALRAQAQRSLEESQASSTLANARIRALMDMTTKTAEVRNLISQIATVDSRYHLPGFKDKIKAPLDAMHAQLTGDADIDGLVRSFSSQIESGFTGEQVGLLALRAGVLAAGEDKEPRQRYERAAKELLAATDAMTNRLTEMLDPFQLAAVLATQRIAKSITTIAQVGRLEASTADATRLLRTLAVEAWRMLSAPGLAELARETAEVEKNFASTRTQLAALKDGLAGVTRAEDIGLLEQVLASTTTVETIVIGPRGVAARVADNLKTLAGSAALLGEVRTLVAKVALEDSALADKADHEQKTSVEAVEGLIMLTNPLLGAIGLIVITIGLVVGRRITGAILATEERDRRTSANLRTLLGKVGDSTQALSEGSRQLTATSNHLATQAGGTSGEANGVSLASAQVSANLDSVAGAAEEMGASIKEISNSASEAAQIASRAVTLAQTANATVAKLGTSSGEIGQITKVISTIAEQTNLLALNATIEAARAGDAGKGFAVVATEVKELARQTATASQDIARKIETIQNDSRGAIGAISDIGSVIGTISQIQTSIASAVEEQTATTREMTGNLNLAAQGCREIAKNILVVSQTASGTAGNAEHVRQFAEQLAKMAGELDRLCAQQHAATTSQQVRLPG